MSDLSPLEIKKLILGYEDLEAGDKAVADSFLKRHPEWAARLKWHQDQESRAREATSGSGEFWDSELLDPVDEEAQIASLHKILAAMARKNINRPLSLVGRLMGDGKWMLPLAAVLALFVFLPRGGKQQLLIQDFSFTQIVLNDDSSRGTTQPARAEGILHTGQAFALDFTLSEDAYLVVYHLSPAGRVSLVYPALPTDDPILFSGDTEHQIPPADSGELWILSTETGTESFLLAASTEIPLGLHGIRIDSGLTDRGEILVNLRNQLEELSIQVDLYEFEHVD
jgi:hypothetical protein